LQDPLVMSGPNGVHHRDSHRVNCRNKLFKQIEYDDEGNGTKYMYHPFNEDKSVIHDKHTQRFPSVAAQEKYLRKKMKMLLKDRGQLALLLEDVINNTDVDLLEILLHFCSAKSLKRIIHTSRKMNNAILEVLQNLPDKPSTRLTKMKHIAHGTYPRRQNLYSFYKTDQYSYDQKNDRSLSAWGGGICAALGFGSPSETGKDWGALADGNTAAEREAERVEIGNTPPRLRITKDYGRHYNVPDSPLSAEKSCT